MDDDKVGNLDSFVDVVANTAGMLIVLVVFVIMLTGKKAAEVDPELMRLSNLTIQISELEQKVETQARNVETVAREHARTRATLRSALATINLTEHDAARVPEIVGAAEEATQSLDMRLSQIEDEARLAGIELEQARAEVAREFPREVIEELEGLEIDALEADLASLREETDALRERAARHESDRAATLDRINALTLEAAVLEAQGGGIFTIVDPALRTEQGRQIIWAECFVPADSEEPSVRILTGENYRRTADGIEPITGGEPAKAVLDSESAFQRHLRSVLDDGGENDGLCLILLVRPDAYGGFRVARKVARDQGWRVDWRPLEALAR